MEFKNMLSPIMIGDCQIKNRFVVPAMDTAYPDENGYVTQRLIDYYEARAKGGFGLIIIEYCHVDFHGKPHHKSISIFDDKYIPGLTKLANAIHKYDGAKAFLQLHHVGRQGRLDVANLEAMEAASPVPDVLISTKTRALTTEEVYALVEKFGDAAVRAQKAGFDGVEIHGGHGYLVSGFMSGVANRRTDEFGGDFRGRMLFPELIIKNIRRKVGNSFPVTIRISAVENVPGGRDIEETRAVAKYLEKVGYQAINVSLGVNGSVPMPIEPNQTPCAFNISNAEQIRRSVSIPVIGGGRINDMYMAEGILEDGRADMIYFGRGSMADPELPNKVAGGAIDEITPCLGCVQRCQLHLIPDSGYNSVSCLMNPFCGKEGEWIKKPAETVKNIAVVGAGPAGLAFAHNAAERGHKVTVFEKTGDVGGQFRIASMPPYKHELARGIKYMLTMCRKRGVEFRLNTEATAEMLLEVGFDSVVLATGGIPLVPPIKGIDGPKVRTAADVLASGDLPIGRILIIGAGDTGVETADYLGHRAITRQVTVVEMGNKICPGKFWSQRSPLLKRVNSYGKVNFMLETKVKEFTEDGAVVTNKMGEEILLSGYNGIILAMGTKPYNPLEERLKGKIELHVIGDAVKASSAMEAIEAGAKLSIEI